MTLGFSPHPSRDAILGEVHARPYQPIERASRILRFAFSLADAQAAAEHDALVALCRRHGGTPPETLAKHHRLDLGDAVLRWERHTEFVSYTWYLPDAGPPFATPTARLAGHMLELPQPGPHLLAIDLHVLDGAADAPVPAAVFDDATLAAARIAEGAATVATDFRADAQGFVRLLLVNHGLDPRRLGAWAHTLLEVETYRVFALLGLPEAQRLAPLVRRIEGDLAGLTRDLMTHERLSDSEAHLERLTRLAADLEAEIAASTYRFQATRAYASIVEDRIAALGEWPVPGYPTIRAFLDRRMAPAMRTSSAVDGWQQSLAERITRASDLLRTRIDVGLAQQNHELLEAMNRRAQLQLRLQQTVEGLSIVAISYYAFGLLSYFLDNAGGAGVPINLPLAKVTILPLIVIVVGSIIVRIRRAHRD